MLDRARCKILFDHRRAHKKEPARESFLTPAKGQRGNDSIISPSNSLQHGAMFRALVSDFLLDFDAINHRHPGARDEKLRPEQSPIDKASNCVNAWISWEVIERQRRARHHTRMPKHSALDRRQISVFRSHISPPLGLAWRAFSRRRILFEIGIETLDQASGDGAAILQSIEEFSIIGNDRGQSRERDLPSGAISACANQ